MLKMNLYWLESFDHSEDWFVVAKNDYEAIGFFALTMGFDPIDDEITAKRVCEITNDISLLDAEFADEDLINDCGGKIIPVYDAELRELCTEAYLECIGGETRIVKILDQTFVEGHIARTILNELGNLKKSNIN
tara:strand:+ start:1558 stop:1959 length:402 start_codon:yes stop_codon:yes gene_type:complete